ncbi:MAG TPA: sugar phosphate isomerase/epimerase [Anaerohalosphaeraceae bacterium]|nr:sugar phosphate isomerase/epimerase [Anaerohalosphaeraceae bacterium]HRT85682.1 sugar phosphate isomerase/epimerase [Anaerohalosphaeraceae bacterium]
MKSKHTRRDFLRAAGVGAASVAAAGEVFGQGRTPASDRVLPDRPTVPPRPMERKFELGMASYTLRKFKLDEAIAMTRRVGLKNIALKDFHLPMNATADEIKAVAAKVKDAGLNLYGCGVVYMRSQADVDRAFEYARTAGMTTIIGVPNHDLLPLVDKKVKEYDIAVAIHNHGPGDKVYPTPASVYEKVKDLDPRIGLCMDIGHTVRIGEDPIRDTMRFADRLLDVHIKDVSAAEAKGSTVEIGRGIIDIPGFIRALLRIGYAKYVSFEYEKDENDPMPGLAESVGYVNGVMATIANPGFTRPRPQPAPGRLVRPEPAR